MGSEFTNADMAAPNLNDFTYKLLGEKVVDGINCYEIEVLPVDEDIEDEFGFLRKIIFVGKSDFVIRKSLIYDFDNELYKKMLVREVQQLSVEEKKYMATNIIIENLQNGRKSEMIMEQLQYNPNVKDEYFTTSYLEK